MLSARASSISSKGNCSLRDRGPSVGRKHGSKRVGAARGNIFIHVQFHFLHRATRRTMRSSSRRVWKRRRSRAGNRSRDPSRIPPTGPPTRRYTVWTRPAPPPLAKSPRARAPPPLPPSPYRTSLVPPLVLSGHAASLTPRHRPCEPLYTAPSPARLCPPLRTCARAAHALRTVQCAFHLALNLKH